MKELPMYSPHPRARLYKRYSDNTNTLPDPSGLITEDERNAWVVELNNYFNYTNFKWVFETELQTNQQQHLTGLVNKLIYVTIKTNTLQEINTGDIIWLQCGIWQQGKYFVVTGEVKQDYVYTPKMHKSYQHIELRSLL